MTRERQVKSRDNGNGRKILAIRVGYALLLLVLAVIFGKQTYVNGIVMEGRVHEARTRLAEKNDRLEQLKNTKLKLKDPEYVAKIAREELYLMKPGEVRIDVTPRP